MIYFKSAIIIKTVKQAQKMFTSTLSPAEVTFFLSKKMNPFNTKKDIYFTVLARRCNFI